MQKVLLQPYCSGPDGAGAALDAAAGTGYPVLEALGTLRKQSQVISGDSHTSAGGKERVI